MAGVHHVHQELCCTGSHTHQFTLVFYNRNSDQAVLSGPALTPWPRCGMLWGHF